MSRYPLGQPDDPGGPIDFAPPPRRGSHLRIVFWLVLAASFLVAAFAMAAPPVAEQHCVRIADPAAANWTGAKVYGASDALAIMKAIAEVPTVPEVDALYAYQASAGAFLIWQVGSLYCGVNVAIPAREFEGALTHLLAAGA